MPYQVQQLIEGKGQPVTVSKADTLAKALSIMIENDFSQLPVVRKEQGAEIPEGMITYESTIRAIRNFGASIDKLHVRDVMINAPVYNVDDELFDILDELKDTNAVLIIEGAYELTGIVTNYDVAEYFRNRTEDLMWVEDVELMLKEFIKSNHQKSNSEVDVQKLDATIAKSLPYLLKENGYQGKKKNFDDLTLNDYILILVQKDTWSDYHILFQVERDYLINLLNGVRDVRNALAHFRGEITPEDRDRLKFAANWFTRIHQEYQEQKEKELLKSLFGDTVKAGGSAGSKQATESEVTVNPQANSAPVYVSTESDSSVGRYALLADWLQSQPGSVDQLPLTINQIEEIIGSELPPSARNHRAWWANDTVSHTQSQQWLGAGWRTTYINLNEARVTFSRIQEREKAYITFFSKLLDELRKKSKIPLRDVSPDGASWVVINTILSNNLFVFSFSRDKRMRVELYLDLGNQDQTKLVFDRLFEQKESIEKQTGPIEWERLNHRRASRLAIYHAGSITEPKGHAELRQWAVDTMIKFYNALAGPAEAAILEAKQA